MQRNRNSDIVVHYFDSKNNNNGGKKLKLYHNTWERFEFYVFFSGGSIAWYLVVFKVLDWHRFPIHMYPFELWLVVIVPILLILIMLNIMDRIFTVKED